MNRAVGISLVVAASIFGFWAVLLMADNAAYAALQDHLPLRTVVGGAKVGGLSASQAAVKLQERASQLEETPISIVVGEKMASLTPKKLGVTVSADPPAALITNRPGQWLHFGFWRSFLLKKDVAFDYTVDDKILAAALEDAFGTSTPSANATLQTDAGQLVVVPHQTGRVIDSSATKAAFTQLATTGAIGTVTLTSNEQLPAVTTEQVIQLKADIETALRPLNFVDNDKTYQIDVATIIPTVDVIYDDQGLRWQVSSDKLKSRLNTTLVRQATVKMSPKTVQAADGVISTAGQDGREVKLDDLTKLVFDAISQKSDTIASPIVIPIKVLPHSEKIVYPSYVAGLFAGKYITINLSEQKMYILEGNNKINEHTVSTGKWNTPTPKGTFYIMNKISLAYSRPFRLWMPMWNGLAAKPDGSGYKGYGIHGLPCWNKSCTSREGQSHIGTPVSHGCIRLNDDAVAFVYNWADVGTPVIIN